MDAHAEVKRHSRHDQRKRDHGQRRRCRRLLLSGLGDTLQQLSEVLQTVQDDGDVAIPNGELDGRLALNGGVDGPERVLALQVAAQTPTLHHIEVVARGREALLRALGDAEVGEG